MTDKLPKTHQEAIAEIESKASGYVPLLFMVPINQITTAVKKGPKGAIEELPYLNLPYSMQGRFGMGDAIIKAGRVIIPTKDRDPKDIKAKKEAAEIDPAIAKRFGI